MDHFGIPITNYNKIGSYLPDATLSPASMFFRYVRMIKTPEEIRRLRESAEMNEQAIHAMLRACRPRMTENELASIYKSEIAKAGGQVYWMHMAVTRGGNYPRASLRPSRPTNSAFATARVAAAPRRTRSTTHR